MKQLPLPYGYASWLEVWVKLGLANNDSKTISYLTVPLEKPLDKILNQHKYTVTKGDIAQEVLRELTDALAPILTADTSDFSQDIRSCYRGLMDQPSPYPERNTCILALRNLESLLRRQ